MTALVVGAGGQLGRALVRRGAVAGLPVVGLTRADLDLTDPDAIAAALDAHRPSLVINAAAFTAVDRAERERLAAFAVNATAVGHLAAACAARSSRLVHVSTDHVFAGERDQPIDEDQPPAPVNVYGASKLAGERAARAAGATVIRTSWLFAPDGWGFVPAIVRAARAGQVIRAIADRHGRPTSVEHLAAAIDTLAVAPVGVYHVAGAEPTTWHGPGRGRSSGRSASRPRSRRSRRRLIPRPRPRPRFAVLATARAEALEWRCRRGARRWRRRWRR
jgi:dTDP-4-dehydrorhamnose reductase